MLQDVSMAFLVRILELKRISARFFRRRGGGKGRDGKKPCHHWQG